ncbi:unnamed protein product [Orchesella dallaii]|uniref:RanBP-type and C3HC4-type zinc finger-containing protein 1 n=1 Tax=Orchesella dallaii TaxID=48710 RepID=A0ABP1PTE7_9HEXA
MGRKSVKSREKSAAACRIARAAKLKRRSEAERENGSPQPNSIEIVPQPGPSSRGVNTPGSSRPAESSQSSSTVVSSKSTRVARKSTISAESGNSDSNLGSNPAGAVGVNSNHISGTREAHENMNIVVGDRQMVEENLPGTSRQCTGTQAYHDGLTCEVYTGFKSSGQLHKAHKLMENQERTGWNQLDAIMKAKGSDAANLHMIPDHIDNMEVLENCSAFDCSICMTEVGVGKGVIIKECLHLYCKDCLVKVIELSDEARIKCPYVNDDYTCACFLQDREIKAIVSPSAYDKYLERSMKLGESSMDSTFHCKTPDCRGWCVYDDGVRDFQCEICTKVNCIPCNAIHHGLSCNDFKNRLVQNTNDARSAEAVQEMINSGMVMRCPKCKIPVEKIEGCDWVECGVCKTEICWGRGGALTAKMTFPVVADVDLMVPFVTQIAKIVINKHRAMITIPFGFGLFSQNLVLDKLTSLFS